MSGSSVSSRETKEVGSARSESSVVDGSVVRDSKDMEDAGDVCREESGGGWDSVGSSSSDWSRVARIRVGNAEEEEEATARIVGDTITARLFSPLEEEVSLLKIEGLINQWCAGGSVCTETSGQPLAPGHGAGRRRGHHMGMAVCGYAGTKIRANWCNVDGIGAKLMFSLDSLHWGWVARLRAQRPVRLGRVTRFGHRAAQPGR